MIAIPRLFALLLAGLFVCVPLAAAPLLQDDDEDTETASSEIDLEDEEVADEDFAFSDVVRFHLWAEGKYVHGEFEMAHPISDGMFTCAHLRFDCDDDEATGINGAEVWYRASVGSRYHPNAYEPPKGDPKPLKILRASYSLPSSNRAADGSETGDWTHQNESMPKPEVEGKVLRFKVPVKVIRARGGRYNSIVKVRAEVETSCSDQPLILDWVANDEGVSIDVDGDPSDWSGTRLSRDAGDELHAAARIADLTEMRVDHGTESLYVMLRTAEEGFGDRFTSDDVQRADAMFVYMEPRQPRYQAPVQAKIVWGSSQQRGRGGAQRWFAELSEDTIEVEFRRVVGQNRFRVLAWSDVRRYDRMAGGAYVALDWGKSK